MENNYIKNGNNRAENPCMTQGEGKNRGRRGREEGKHWIGWRMLRAAVVLGVMMAWIVPAVAQTGYSGVYYLSGNNQGQDSYNVANTTTNYYLCPTEDWIYYQATNNFTTTDNGQPFLTTYQYRNGTNDSTKAVWIIKKHPLENYYYIIHAKDGKYMTSNGGITGSQSSNRIRVHLEETNSPNDNMLFNITLPSYYNISPKNNSGWYLNITQGNQNSLQGTDAKQDGPEYTLNGVTSRNVGGTIGLWNKGNDYTSKWYFEDAKADLTPTISDINPADNTFTITSPFVPTGCSIIYTTDGSDPSSSNGTTYTDAVPVTETITVKAAVVGYEMVLSNIVSKSLSPVIAAPVVTNNFDGTISLSTVTIGATIYYTTNGDTPDNTSTAYSSAFSLGDATVIKAIAYLGSDFSDVTTYNVPQYTEPTISFNSATSLVTIDPGSGGTAYYNTGDGSQADPTTSSTVYSAPFTVSSATTVKAIATHAGYLTSTVAELAITQVATPTIQNNGSNAISITTATDGATIYYTTDGSTPTTSSTEYTEPLTENVSGVTIKAIAVKVNMITSAVGSGSVTLQCAAPVITRNGNTGFIATCAFPATGVTIYYTTDGSTTPTTSTPTHINSGESVAIALPVTVKAIAVATNYNNSTVTTTTVNQGMGGNGTEADPYTIEYQSDVADFVNKANTPGEASKFYKVISATPLDFGSAGVITQPFSGNFDGNLQTLTGLTHALFNTVDGGVVRNVILKDVIINGSGNIGAICNEATGTSRIYNCGILPSTITYNAAGVITATGSTVASTSGYCGSLVGKLENSSRVINCFSYAFVTGGTTVAGIVGYIGSTEITQDNVATVPMVVNCMFYGDITGGTTKYPVYGGAMIKNDRDNNKGVNPYDYFRKSATFDNAYDPDEINQYNRSWPAEEKNLVRFEYYRSVLNGNRRLCTWWVNGTNGTAPTDADVANVGIAKWVLDKTIAPYPILKKWGKYPSIINIDPEYVYDSRTQTNVARTSANEWEGKQMGTLKVNIYAGEGNTSVSSSYYVTKNLVCTDMDTLNYDYCAYKVQLPYYNDIFGDSTETTNHVTRYGHNYTDKVVTGWMVTGVTGGTPGTFEPDWQTGYNFADRKCTDKDLYDVSHRVFAQGGYYYVPEGVTEINITAKWGKAVYLANRGRSIDRVKLTPGGQGGYKADQPFTPAGTIEDNFQGRHVYDDLQDAIQALGTATVTNDVPDTTVYDQAIVLIGNHQVKNGSTKIDNSLGGWHPFTIMSADFDFDNEPDYCLQLQFRNDVDRPGIQPVRFDFLPVVELGLAVRHDERAYAIGIFVPQGHFEVTETSFMRTTQFEYYHYKNSSDFVAIIESKSPIIINGGEFELFNVRRPENNNNLVNRTSYFLLGGHAWVHRFAPGPHPNNGNAVPKIALCAVNAIGGEYPEFYLSGINRPDHTTPNDQNPHCYTNGGKFGIMAGAGYEEIKCDSVTFMINRSLITEFYGGGMNGSKPVRGKIVVDIDNSKVKKYCGGPEVGVAGFDDNLKTVTTKATGTIFGTFYGGGNGGNSSFRQMKDDGDWSSSLIGNWTMRKYKWNLFNPLGIYPQGEYYYPNSDQTLEPYYDDGDDNKGYQSEYECEVFNQSNGVKKEVTMRGFIHWIQFGKTNMSNVTNTLTDCIVEENFYGGGNLGTVTGTVTSTLTNCTVMHDVFGGGYSATIPTFSIQDKTQPGFPTIDAAGTITEAVVNYIKDDGVVRSYEWTNDLNGETEEVRKASPGYLKDGKWYCWTWVPLENLGAVTSNATITLKGNTEVYGNVFGGGDASTVNGNATVTITGNAEVKGNVFGGGNAASVGVVTSGTPGNTTVKLQQGAHVLGNVYGGGNNGPVGGDSQVKIQDE